MAAPEKSFVILGVTVGRVEPVRSLAHIAFGERVTALYGLNGAGKTQMLALAEMALGGIRPEGTDEEETPRSVLDVHIRLTLRDDDGHHMMPRPLQQCVSRAIQRHRDPRSLSASRGSAVEGLPALLEQLLENDHVARRSEAAETPDPLLGLKMTHLEHWESALRCAVDNGRLTLRASGSEARPSWDVFVAVSPEDALGLAALRSGDEFFREMRASSPQEQREFRATDHRKPLIGEAWDYFGNWFDAGRAGSEGGPQVPMIHVGTVARSVWAEIDITLNGGRAATALDSSEGFSLARIVGRDATTADIDHITMNELTKTTGRIYGEFLEPDGSISDSIRAEVDARSTLATQLYSQMMPARELRFDLGTAENWIHGHLPSWYADGTHLSRLSSAQARWARVCIQVSLACREYLLPEQDATDGCGPDPVFLLFDEPELGLHRLLEHRLARGLNTMMREVDGIAVVATHSPGLLASPVVRPIFVSKDDESGTVVRPIPISLVDGMSSAMSAQELGVTTGDLWTLGRLTVVVEGIHDEWVFKSLLRNNLDWALAAIFPIHGGARLRSLAEARLLVVATDAPVLVVLDEMTASLSSRLLEDIKVAASTGTPEELRKAMEELRNTKGDSYLFLHQFAHAALEMGVLERIFVHGLSLPDIICYLPPELLLTSPTPWQELISQWRVEAAPKEASNIKGWLRRKKLLPDEDAAINAAIESASDRARRRSDPVHPDLVALGLHIMELAHRGEF